jgi:hypothetical protein
MMIDHVGFSVRTAAAAAAAFSRLDLSRSGLFFAAHDWAKVVCLNKGAIVQMQDGHRALTVPLDLRTVRSR